MDELSARIVDFVRANPGCGTRAMRGMGRADATITAAADKLVEEGLLENHGTKTARRLHVKPARQTADAGFSVSGLTRIMVCPDAHHPYADDLAWRTFLAAAREIRPDVLVIIGDFADCESVSFHPKDPSRRADLKGELDAVNAELDAIENLRIPRVEFVCGNHELRLQRYLWERAPQLYGLVEISDLLRIKQRGWGWTPYRESLQIGKIHFSHDVGRCGKYTASQSLTDYGHSIVMGHSHRAATVYGGTVKGDRQVAMNVGTLIDVKSVDYRHRAMAAREWQLGFGMINMTSDGVGWCTFCPIIDGRVVVDGRLITGRKAAA